MRDLVYRPQAGFHDCDLSTGISGGIYNNQSAPRLVYRRLSPELMMLGTSTAEQQIQALEKRYGLDKPLYYQFLKWIRDLSVVILDAPFSTNREVSELIWNRLGLL